MSPLLKAVGIGILMFAASLLIMYGISKAMNRPFLPRFPRATVVSPPPTQPVFPF